MNRQEIVNTIAAAIDAVIFKPRDVMSLDINREAIDAAEVCVSKFEQIFAGEPLSEAAKTILLEASERAKKRTADYFSAQEYVRRSKKNRSG